VAKILVADDNSNIQKMVGLALKDQGIDVVAVGNGEAAVRKISDIRPDLVLADVFMPVRNGYEVCQYVKSDPSLAHIPVILLVGAFDPLDEQEAQRVGADGVLKKPFVPPDPLISMVKSALQRAGVAHGIAVKAAEEEAMKASDLLRPSTPPPPIPAVASSSVHSAPVETPIAPLDQESFVDEAPTRPEPVRIDSGSQTVAFGSLLETPADGTEDDPAFLPPKNSELATDRDWRAPDTEATDEEEEEEDSSSWRREEAESIADAAAGVGKKKWKSTGGFEPVLAGNATVGSWESEADKAAPLETALAASNSVTQAPPVPAAIPEAVPSLSARETNVWPPAVSPALQQKSQTETSVAVEETARPSEHAQSSAEAAVAGVPDVKKEEPEKKASKDSWFSVPSNPWNAEMEKANRLASAWDSTMPVAAPPASSNGTEKAAESISEETQKVIEQAALPVAAVEAIREEDAHVAEDAAHAVEQHNADGTSFYAPEALVETPAAAPAAAPSMDDLVARVLANMSPEVLQAVTREILRPVVEAMVKEELKSKKS
jgi:CheY-like chemotaxis protein